MTVPTLVATVEHAGNPTTAPTLTFGATQADDILFAFFTNGGADADPTLSGTTISTGGLTWTKHNSVNGGALTDMNGSLWWARATNNHTGQTVIGATTNSGAAVGGVLRGCPTSGDPFETLSSALNASGVNSVAGGTPSVNDTLIVLFLATDDNIVSDTYTATGTPSTLNEQRDALSTGGVDCAAALASGQQTTATSTGIVSWNNARGVGVYQVALLVAVKPLATPHHPATVTVPLGALTVGITATPAHPATVAVTLGGLAVAVTAVASLPATPPFGFSLNDPASAPTVDTDHTMWAQAWRPGSTATLHLEVRQGAVVIEAWTHSVDTSEYAYAHPLDPVNVANITDYTDLRVYGYFDGPAGGQPRIGWLPLFFPPGTTGTVNATVAVLLGALSVTGNASVEHLATVAVDLGSLAVVVAAVVERDAIVAVPLGSLAVVTTATPEHPATVAAPLGALTVTAAATPDVGAVVVVNLGALTATTIVTKSASATVAVLLGGLAVTVVIVIPRPQHLAGREPATMLEGREPERVLVGVGSLVLEGNGPVTLLEGNRSSTSLSGLEPVTTLSGEELS